MPTGAIWASTTRFIRSLQGHLIYANYSGWDIYRSEMPLLAHDRAAAHGGHGAIHRADVPAGRMDRPLAADQSLHQRDGGQPADGGAGHGVARRPARIRHERGVGGNAARMPPRLRRPGIPIWARTASTGSTSSTTCPTTRSTTVLSRRLQEDAIAYASLYRLAVALGKTDDAKMLYDRALYLSQCLRSAGSILPSAQRRRPVGAGLRSYAGLATALSRAQAGITSGWRRRTWRGWFTPWAPIFSTSA